MIIYKKDILKLLAFVTTITVLLFFLLNAFNKDFNKYKLGGFIHHRERIAEKTAEEVFKNNMINIPKERFQRPSKIPALDLKYKYNDELTGYPEKYTTSRDVILAYYSILRDAANMIGYQGGCGTVGRSRTPYPSAYNLLSDSTREEITYKEFEKSFAGIGHTTLLKLYPAYRPPNTPENIKYYMVEIEIITGPPVSGEEEYKPNPTYFAYYYGIITTVYDENEGWKIKSTDYIPEDFLCAPYHLWDWYGRYLVEGVYVSWYKIIDKIDYIEKKDSLIYIYASGHGKKYRFDFVRLTNGEDVLLHEYMKQNDKWVEVNILKPEHQSYKLSILNF